ncbi:hypothetical protein J7E79_27310 [Bacillus sp. ISL-40]|uniref:hypothetical protein n=1 Tax=unclassified Bacillus (in: firmicutes) TaxID=185979 RepID=UPI001BEC80D5|nr:MULTISPECIES: hypothetical protein [unclassified Bacillus (in: firmicutes)]MBT2701006.1 hypothetical protein [Bacillus sp. ISL-40]MBT2739338.1 hypothetical protein [Bacillus sp. ISL-77]
MDRTAETRISNVSNFSEIVRRAYETGKNENGITLEKLIADLTADLKNLMAV